MGRSAAFFYFYQQSTFQMKIKKLLFLLFTAPSLLALGQQSPVKYQVEAQAIGTTNNVVPFWMRSNQFGSVPSEGASGSIIGRVYKEYEEGTAGRLDWGAGFEGRANGGKDSKLFLIEAYLKLKLGIFELKGGRTKDVMGLNGDSILSSGNFAQSGNALGIPKLELSIPDYYTIPIWDGLLSFKGTFSHGWLGKTRILDTIRGGRNNEIAYPTLENNPTTYFHQKSFYGRIGKPEWKAKIYGGFSHQVFWGNEKDIYGEQFDLSNLGTFLYVITGKTYGSGYIPRSKIGNQAGSIDVGLEYEFDKLKLLLYRQNMYDVGALSKLANIKDGLNGIALENIGFQTTSSNFKWKKILFELLYTKHQAGEFGSKRTNSGDEDYYNNYFYVKGWSYNGLGIGTPLISPKHSTRSGLPSYPGDYFINNRVVAFHLGMQGEAFTWKFLAKGTFSRNYGTFGTSPEGHSTGEIEGKEPIYGLFGKKNQLSAYFESSKSLKNGMQFGYALSVDKGDLLYNSGGLILKLSKSF